MHTGQNSTAAENSLPQLGQTRLSSTAGPWSRFTKKWGLLPTVAGESVSRNKIPETPQHRRLCNGMKTLISDHDYKLHLGGTAKPGIQKTLGCRADLESRLARWDRVGSCFRENARL
jgi:hypothetical protein